MSATEEPHCFALINKLASLSEDRHVLIGSPVATETFWDCRHVLDTGLLYIDTMRKLDGPQPCGLTLVAPPEQSLIELAANFGLRNCYEVDPLAQARCANVRAQLLWLNYVATTMSSKTANSLFAAFQAWQAIERARPVPF